MGEDETYRFRSFTIPLFLSLPKHHVYHFSQRLCIFPLFFCIVLLFSLDFRTLCFVGFPFPKTQPKRIVPRLASVSQVESLFHSYQHTNAQQKQHYSQHNNTIYQLVTQDNPFRHRDVVSSSNWKRLSFSGFESRFRLDTRGRESQVIECRVEVAVMPRRHERKEPNQ